MTRPSRFRSELAVVALAMFLTGGLAVIASRGEGGPAQARERVIDEMVEAEQRALGWEPPAGEPAAALRAQGVDLLVALQPFELPLGHGTVSGDAPPDAPMRAAATLVAAELGRLPASFLAAARLRRVLLCGALHEDRRPIPSLPNYKDTLLLDVSGSRPYLRRLLHHELFHFADLADDGTVLRDPAWTALNPPGFAYVSDGRAMRDPAAGRLAFAPPGFPTRYATSALEEDKAEVFALMLAEPAALAARAPDSILAAKVALIRALTIALSGEMETFWAAP